PPAFAPLVHRRCGLAPAPPADCPPYSRLRAGCRRPGDLPTIHTRPVSALAYSWCTLSLGDGRTRRGGDTREAGVPSLAVWQVLLGILDFLCGPVCFVPDLLRAPRCSALGLVDTPPSSVRTLLRAPFHRTRSVFDALFDLISRVP